MFENWGVLLGLFLEVPELILTSVNNEEISYQSGPGRSPFQLKHSQPDRWKNQSQKKSTRHSHASVQVNHQSSSWLSLPFFGLLTPCLSTYSRSSLSGAVGGNNMYSSGTQVLQAASSNLNSAPRNGNFGVA